MSDNILYQVFKINNFTREIQETFEFLSISDFKKKYPKYYYSQSCLYKPNYLEIIAKTSEFERKMIQINSSLGEIINV